MVTLLRFKTSTYALAAVITLLIYFSGPSTVGAINTARVVLSNTGGSNMQMTNIMGKEITFPNGKIVREFLGIPYAQAPVGERRFRVPFPFGSLGYSYNATAMKPTCAQSVAVGDSNTSHEDCLYLNIWAPNDLYKFGAGFPILVAFISGGFEGTNQNHELFKGLKLAESEDIIVVTVSYRSGVFGFLRADGLEIPGNFGLYDQKVALEWITANINEFGGDRSRITLLGNGASAATIGYLLLSNTIGNLFKWAIIHGGSPLSDWAYVEPSVAEGRAAKLAEYVGCKNKKRSEELAACLRTVESGKLLAASARIIPNSYYQYVFAPTQDGIIVTENPSTLLKKGYNKKTEIMIGCTESEGSHFLENLFQDIRMVDNSASVRNTKMSYYLFKFATSLLFGASSPPIGSLAANQNVDKTMSPKLQELIMFEYRNWEQPDNETAILQSFLDMIQDKNYNCPILEFARAFASSGSGAYVFKLPYLPLKRENSWSTGSTGTRDTPSMKEVYDTGIQLPFGNSVTTSSFLEKFVMSAWGNMTKSGNPNTGVVYTSMLPDLTNSFAWDKWDPYNRVRMVFQEPLGFGLDREKWRYEQPDIMRPDVWDMSSQCKFWLEHMPWQLARERESCKNYDQP